MNTRLAKAVIPIKRFASGKSRLAARLSEADRAALSERMFEHVLSTTLSCVELAGVLVLTDAPEIASAARARGAEVLEDPVATLPSEAAQAPANDAPRLALLIDAALAHLRAQGVEVALVLMADLPRMRAADLSPVLAALDAHDLTLVPDLRGECTNALALRLGPTADRFRTAFGNLGSLQLHVSAARALGLRVCVQESPRLALDLDLPADLDLLVGLHHD